MRKTEVSLKTDVFRYLDYRRFLMDITQELREKANFNVRLFAKKAGLKAPSYLKMVMDGRRNVTVETAHKFCRALEVTGRQELYFEKLVLYNQTTDPDLKKRYLEELIILLPRSPHFVLEKQQSRYLSRPHYVSLREMVVLKDFKEDYKWIAERLNPPISPQEAKEAVQALLELGLLKRDQAGKLMQAQDCILTEDKNTKLVQAYHFHEAMIDKARHALGHIPQKERNYYCLTLPLPLEMFDEIVKAFYEFRDKIVNLASQGGKNFDEVYQINFQFFPLTQKREDNES